MKAEKDTRTKYKVHKVRNIHDEFRIELSTNRLQWMPFSSLRPLLTSDQLDLFVAQVYGSTETPKMHTRPLLWNRLPTVVLYTIHSSSLFHNLSLGLNPVLSL